MHIALGRYMCMLSIGRYAHVYVEYKDRRYVYM